MEANVYLDDVNVVYVSNIDLCDELFIDRDDAIKFTKEAIKEHSEELTEEEMKRYGYDKDAEDYIEEIKLNPTKDLRAATDENGKLILESIDVLDGEWHPCIYVNC